jgi:hypothetical protein
LPPSKEGKFTHSVKRANGGSGQHPKKIPHNDTIPLTLVAFIEARTRTHTHTHTHTHTYMYPVNVTVLLSFACHIFLRLHGCCFEGLTHRHRYPHSLPLCENIYLAVGCVEMAAGLQGSCFGLLLLFPHQSHVVRCSRLA